MESEHERVRYFPRSAGPEPSVWLRPVRYTHPTRDNSRALQPSFDSSHHSSSFSFSISGAGPGGLNSQAVTFQRTEASSPRNSWDQWITSAGCERRPRKAPENRGSMSSRCLTLLSNGPSDLNLLGEISTAGVAAAGACLDSQEKAPRKRATVQGIRNSPVWAPFLKARTVSALGCKDRATATPPRWGPRRSNPRRGTGGDFPRVCGG
jgi:hypothetical protein